MRFALFLGSLHVGDVELTRSDKLAAQGTLTLASIPDSHPDAARLRQFIDLNAECMGLSERLDEAGVAAELQSSSAELSTYSDLADSPDWVVVDANGRTLPILCPLFAHGGDITWRWGDS